MSCPELEKINAAPQSPRCTTPPQVESNRGAAHAESDAERMETESGEILDPMSRNNSTSRRAILHERCFRHLVVGSIQASLFSTTIFAYVLCAIMTRFSGRLFATEP